MNGIIKKEFEWPLQTGLYVPKLSSQLERSYKQAINQSESTLKWAEHKEERTNKSTKNLLLRSLGYPRPPKLLGFLNVLRFLDFLKNFNLNGSIRAGEIWVFFLQNTAHLLSISPLLHADSKNLIKTLSSVSLTSRRSFDPIQRRRLRFCTDLNLQNFKVPISTNAKSKIFLNTLNKIQDSIRMPFFEPN